MTYIYIGQYYDKTGRELNIKDKKIGITGDLNAREFNLNQTKGPIGYTMLSAWDLGDDAKKIEGALHAILNDSNTDGEWFEDDDSSLIYRVSIFMEKMGYQRSDLKANGSEEQNIIDATKSDLDQRALRHKFWEGWVAYARKNSSLRPHNGRDQSWNSITTGVRGCLTDSGLTVNKGGGSISVYFTSGRDGCHRLFDYLFENKQYIEEKFGNSLEWDKKEDRNSINIIFTKTNTSIKTDNDWQSMYAWLLEHQTKLRNAILPYIQDFNWDENSIPGSC